MTTQTMHRAPAVAVATVDAERLYDHLVNDHGRAPHEMFGLPLDAVHKLEHFDVEMGLLTLDHRHPHPHPHTD